MTITKTYTKDEIFKLKASLSKGKQNKTPNYALFQIKMSDCTITAYESLKVVFQGEGAEFYSSMSGGTVATKKSKPTTTQTYEQVFPQSGSDEVGTGDYFGPVVVCAAHVKISDQALLNELRIQDSKQIDDAQIRLIAPKLIEQLTHSLLILNNAKYNQVQPTNNMNQIKAKLHNQAYVNLIHKYNVTLETTYVDQFAQPKNYFQYLQSEKEVIRNIHFETKAENKFVSVACASIIARYHFLECMDKMSEAYDFEFPKGAGAHVDIRGKEFVARFGQEELKNVCKYHFKNTEKILND